MSDFPSNPRWQSGQKECRLTSEPPLRVGSTYDQHAHFLGRDMVNSFEVTRLELGRLVAFRSTGGTFPISVERTVEPLGAGRARFTEHVVGDPQGFFKLAEPALRRLVKASIRRDFPRLKGLLEGASGWKPAS